MDISYKFPLLARLSLPPCSDVAPLESSGFRAGLLTSIGRYKDLVELLRCDHRRLAVEVTSRGPVRRRLIEGRSFLATHRHYVRAPIGEVASQPDRPAIAGRVGDLLLVPPRVFGIRSRDGPDK